VHDVFRGTLLGTGYGADRHEATEAAVSDAEARGRPKRAGDLVSHEALLSAKDKEIQSLREQLAAAQTATPAAPSDSTEPDDELGELSDDDLAARYQALSGKEPDGRWKRQRIIDEITKLGGVG